MAGPALNFFDCPIAIDHSKGKTAHSDEIGIGATWNPWIPIPMQQSLSVFTPVDRLLCSKTGIQIITMLLVFC